MTQVQVKNRPDQLVAMMEAKGVSRNFVIFAQKVFNCVDMAAASAKVELVVSSDEEKTVTVLYRVTSSITILKIMELVCGNKNSIDLASIRMAATAPSIPGEIKLSVRISSTPAESSSKTRTIRFPNRPSD